MRNFLSSAIVAAIAISVTSCGGWHTDNTKYYTADGTEITIAPETPPAPAAPKKMRKIVTVTLNEQGDTIAVSETWEEISPVIQITPTPVEPIVEPEVIPVEPVVEAPIAPEPVKFDPDLAVTLWQKMRRGEQFTQDDYAKSIELCCAGYDRLTEEYEKILASNAPVEKKKKMLVDLDADLTGQMINFCTTMSRRLHIAGSSGLMELENVEQLNIMLAKKQLNRTALNKVKQL